MTPLSWLAEPPVWLCNVVFLGCLAWFIRHVVRGFGWEGLLVKVAGAIDGFFMAFVVAVHQAPWAAFRNRPGRTPPIDHASLPGAAAVWLVWSWLLYADRPRRWLMRPPVKWALYAGAALVFAGDWFAAGGWL